MVQGLAFLSKKSWHTKNLNNQEKVWIAEQQQEQERIKTTELAKQIQLEREQNEINDITGNNKSKLYDRGIDWMYTGQAKDSQLAQEDAQKAAEEYLLGKPIAFHGVSNTAGTALVDNSQEVAATGINAVVLSTTDSTVEAEDRKQTQQAATTYNQNHKYEDPMYAISLQAVRKEKMIEQQMQLYNRVGIKTTLKQKDDDYYTNKSYENDTRSNQQEDYVTGLKTNIDKRHKKRKRSYSDDSNYDKEEDRHSKKKKHKKKKHHKKSSRKEESSRDHNRTTESSRRRRYDSDESDDNSDVSRNNKMKRSTRSRRYNSDSSDTYSSMSYDRNRNRTSYHRDNDKITSPKLYNVDNLDNHNDKMPQASSTHQYGERKYGYGLQSKDNTNDNIKTSTDKQNSERDLGPDKDLVQRKRNEKMMSYRNEYQRDHRQRDHRQPITSEDRAKALLEMENNAKSYDARRRQQKSYTEETMHFDRRSTSDIDDSNVKRSFINDISEQVHGIYNSSSRNRK